jgi:2-(3-amino-3-carboxypropyl)histidine synthase
MLMEYDLELDRVVEEIKKNNAKTVLLQLGDGLKPRATEITKLLEKETSAQIFIWSDSCYGACDLPNVNVDLIIQFGHNEMMPSF